MRIYLILISLLLLFSCAPIKHYEIMSKKTGIVHTVSIGSELYRIKKERDLPNVFGKADIHGGKIEEGLTELRFMGIADDGKIMFRLTDIDIQSNETVFTRYGANRTTINTNANANVSVYGNSAFGSGNANTVITEHDKPEAQITKLPNTVDFVFDPKDKYLKLEDITVEVIDATKYSLSYTLHKEEVQ